MNLSLSKKHEIIIVVSSCIVVGCMISLALYCVRKMNETYTHQNVKFLEVRCHNDLKRFKQIKKQKESGPYNLCEIDPYNEVCPCGKI